MPKKIPTLLKSDLVYKLYCNVCDARYVGTTKRKLKNRINEHASALSSTLKSNVADHSLDTGHAIDFHYPEIVHQEHNPVARRFLEGLEIEREKYLGNELMNDQQNMQNKIPRIYHALFNKK